MSTYRKPYRVPVEDGYQSKLDDRFAGTTPALNMDGGEVLDGTPVAPPVGYKKQPSMMENIRNMIRSEQLRQAAAAQGFETPEEADDFDIGDDFDPTSPYEHNFDPPEPLQDLSPPVQSPPEAPTANPPADGPPASATAPAPAGGPAPAQARSPAQ